MNDAPVPPPPPSGKPQISQPPAFSPAQYPPSTSNRSAAKIIVGILGGLLLLAMLAVGGCVAFLFTVLKSNEPYQHAVQVVARDARAQKALGTPIKPGWLVSGSVNVSGPSGDADLSIPVRGPSSSGTVYVVAKKSAGRWQYQTLDLQLEGVEERINLLPAGGP